MDRERFEHLLAAYGADFSRWPANERAAGAAYAAEHGGELEAALADARAIDAALDPVRPDRFDVSALAVRLIAAAPKRQMFDRRAALALAACAVFGVVLGYGGGQFAPAPVAEDDSFFALAFEAPWVAAEDEG